MRALKITSLFLVGITVGTPVGETDVASMLTAGA